jgi:arginyl-tRNA synthetase
LEATDLAGAEPKKSKKPCSLLKKRTKRRLLFILASQYPRTLRNAARARRPHRRRHKSCSLLFFKKAGLPYGRAP